ncbi:acyl-CoA dehydrogenase family protein [Pseudofrankia inefficax]|uniref:Acyl-CoA dehydrogenase domain-containing protein n=1 Tax=Pseudofrankia inefficax (strain DSM 45817 / CECT 9037 / DDB 130130 / EuI1c) TaxID=298654 RepID=E3J895_PSEI1|nr:acyl-CoA dehydrogenase family protein [Pseudofrankia inefficax]ADP83288.1 acyl-CoA dehydrogenase domain-containing protein [Pseudofrankia inefficax]
MTDTPEIARYRAAARQWLAANLEARDPSQPHNVRGAGELSPEEYRAERALQKKLYEAGYAGINWPSEYGGQGLTDQHARVFAEEAVQYRTPELGHAGGTTYGPCGQTIVRHGSPEFLTRHVPRMLAGDELFVQLFSEPSAGSDMAGITTRAVREGDRWLITGSKIWTSGAHYADYGMCLARTDWDAPKHRGLTWFAVPLRAKGVAIHPIREITGDAEFCQEFLDEVEVGDEDIIGEINQGWTVAQTLLLVERGAGRDDPLNMPAAQPAVIDPQLLSLTRAAGRAQDPVARQTVARIHTADWAKAMLGQRITGLLRSGEKPAAGVASYWKLAAGIYNPERARLVLEIGQGLGLVWKDGDEEGNRAALDYLNSRVWSIAGGSNEMQRNAISEQVLGMPREPSFDKGKPFREVVNNAREWLKS